MTFVQKQGQLERNYKGILRDYFESQEKQVLANLTRVYPEKSVKHFIDFVFPPADKEIERLAKVSAPILKEAMIQGIRTTLEELQAPRKAEGDVVIDFGLYNPRISEYLENFKKKQATDITMLTNETLRDSLAEGLEAGEAIQALRERVSVIYADNMGDRSLMIARTETARAMVAGEVAGYKENGIESLTWITALDEASCEECEGADNATVMIGELFPEVDVDEPPAHPNCRCDVMAGRIADEGITEE